MNTYTALIKQDSDWWIGWIEEIPGTNCQEATHEELVESIQMVLEEAVDAANDKPRISKIIE